MIHLVNFLTGNYTLRGIAMAFKIRGVHDDFLPVNRRAIEKILRLTEQHIPDMSDESLVRIRSLFSNPVYNMMRHYFFIAENNRGEVLGFAQMSYAMDLKYCFLDLLASNPGKTYGGIGGALYKRVRDEAIHLNATALFIECLTDDPKYITDASMLRQNRARLKFYEGFGARPVINRSYDNHTLQVYGNSYYLVYDSLVTDKPIPLKQGKKIIRSIIERKHNTLNGESDIKKVTAGMKDDPLQIRIHRYKKTDSALKIPEVPDDRKIILLYNQGHEIHHIQDKGYVEAPVRIKSILKKIEKSDLFVKHKMKHYPERHITAVHDKAFVEYFKKASASVPPGVSIYPDTFPIRKNAKPPKNLVSRAGYYCIDIYSPVNRNSYIAARSAVDCALTGADLLLMDEQIVYALVRPPGHHAEKSSFGGFCYFNSAAIAANYLTKYGRAAILDLDYHHGNGQQDIFYSRNDVLTISIHADTDYEYPYFSGFSNEKGNEEGYGYNINYPLPRNIDGKKYNRVLSKAVKAVKEYNPDFLIIALGLDTAKGDPSGKWQLLKEDFYNNGVQAGSLGKRTLVVQEGGYDSRVLGTNALSFFQGLYAGRYRNSRN
jgi:acetoin utilization deacetylase AcuC-like enzyme